MIFKETNNHPIIEAGFDRIIIAGFITIKIIFITSFQTKYIVVVPALVTDYATNNNCGRVKVLVASKIKVYFNIVNSRAPV